MLLFIYRHCTDLNTLVGLYKPDCCNKIFYQFQRAIEYLLCCKMEKAHGFTGVHRLGEIMTCPLVDEREEEMRIGGDR